MSDRTALRQYPRSFEHRARSDRSTRTARWRLQLDLRSLVPDRSPLPSTCIRNYKYRLGLRTAILKASAKPCPSPTSFKRLNSLERAEPTTPTVARCRATGPADLPSPAGFPDQFAGPRGKRPRSRSGTASSRTWRASRRTEEAWSRTERMLNGLLPFCYPTR